MPAPNAGALTLSAFRDQLTKELEFDLPDFQKAYRKQRTRVLVGVTLGILGFALGLLSFFPATSIVFIFILYLIYLFLFGRTRRRRRRVQKDSDLRRLLIKATVRVAGLPFEFQTHRYMPAYVIRESELFPFKADQYQADELVDVQAAGKFSFSHIRASEHVDAFERSNRDQKSFEGWLFRIFPPRHAQPAEVTLPASYQVRISPDQVWMAVPQSESLYQQKLLTVEPNAEACYALYTAMLQAEAMTR
jgi:hypothetical protein